MSTQKEVSGKDDDRDDDDDDDDGNGFSGREIGPNKQTIGNRINTDFRTIQNQVWFKS